MLQLKMSNVLGVYASQSFIHEQDWLNGEFKTKVLGLIGQIMENRLRHARGFVHTTNSVTFIDLQIFFKSKF